MKYPSTYTDQHSWLTIVFNNRLDELCFYLGRQGGTIHDAEKAILEQLKNERKELMYMDIKEKNGMSYVVSPGAYKSQLELVQYLELV